MPWCHECDRYLSPPTVLTDGSCPACGSPVDAGAARHRRVLPWHVKAVLATFVLYLGYRTFQGIEWLVRQI